MQFVLQGHEYTKETGYCLVHSLHFKILKILRRLDTVYCAVCTSGPRKYTEVRNLKPETLGRAKCHVTVAVTIERANDRRWSCLLTRLRILLTFFCSSLSDCERIFYSSGDESLGLEWPGAGWEGTAFVINSHVASGRLGPCYSTIIIFVFFFQGTGEYLKCLLYALKL